MLFANPRARAMRAFRSGVPGLCARLGLPATAAITDRNRWAEPGPAGRVVAVAGGDGTLRAAVDALGPGARIVPVPMGHGNDLCRRLGLPPEDVDDSRRRLDNPVWREVDLWRATDAAGRARRFVNSLGIGLDAAVNRRRESLPRWIPYIPLFLLTLSRLRRVALEVSWDGHGWAGKTWWLGLMNSGLTGGGLILSPDADPGDGRLDMFAVRTTTKAGLLAMLPKAKSGQFGKGVMARAQAAAFTIRGPEQVDIALDGDLVPASLPLRVELEGSVFLAA